jgi:actin-related protein
MEERNVFYYLFDGQPRISDRHREAAAVEFKEEFCYCEDYDIGFVCLFKRSKWSLAKYLLRCIFRDDLGVPQHLKHYVGLMEDKRKSIAMSAFYPENVGLNCQSLQQLIVDVIQFADEQLHETLFSSVVVFGGSSLFKGEQIFNAGHDANRKLTFSLF